MARIVLALLLIVGIFSTAYGYELTLAKQIASKIAEKARNLVGNQKQSELSLDLPENAFPVKNLVVPYSCHEDGLFPYPRDCTLGVRCVGGINTVFSCTDVLHFNNVTKKCESFCSAQCDPILACVCGWDTCQSSKDTVTTEESEADEPVKNKLKSSHICLNDGFFPNPTDCNQFIYCSKGKAFLKMCPSGLHFNRETEQCEQPCMAACDPTLSCKWRSGETFHEEVDCVQEYDSGTCQASLTRFYFDMFSGQCLEFKYGGCGGNRNNFETMEECENKCLKKLLKSTEVSLTEGDEAGDSEEDKLKISFTCRRDGFFAHPNLCNQYIECLDGTPILQTCPSGLHFRKKTKTCDMPCIAKCDPKISCKEKSIRIPVTEVPDAEEITVPYSEASTKKVFKLKLKFVCFDDGLFPHSSDCSKYINCSLGTSYEQACPSGKHFNSLTKRCEAPCSAKCDPNIICGWRTFRNHLDESIMKEIVDNLCTKDAVFTSPLSCEFYFRCQNGHINAFRCPEGQHFNNKTEKCEEPCDAYCEPSIAEKCGWKDIKETERKYIITDEELCTKKGSYKQQNPKDCETYFECKNGDVLLLFCPDGQHFNQESLRCEEPCDAQCDSSLAEECGWDHTTEAENDNSLKQPMFDFQCFGNGLFANIACENFIQCTGGQAYLVNCPQGQHFNPYAESCTSPCEARCVPNYEDYCTDEEKHHSPKQLLKDFDCETDGYHVNPLDCGSFIQCFRGSAYAIACPADLHYSPTLEICMTPCDAKCAPNYEEYCIDDTWNRRKSPLLRSNSVKQPFPLVSEFICTKDGYYPNPEECTSYIQCMTGESFIKLCPEGLHFSEKTEKCETPCDAHCDCSIGDTCGWDESRSPTDSSQDTTFDYSMFLASNSPSLMYHFTCMKDGIYKNPENCTTFIQCAGGHSYIMACPEGLHFNDQIKGCDYPCSAHCDTNLACECGWDTCAHNEETSDEVDCEAEPEEGPCKGRFRRYAYDSWSGRCRGFVYGGCDGNSNNFKTMDECENKCRKKLLRGFRCPEDNGMFGHYPDCMSYYHCKRGIPTLKKCPKGTAFDHKKSKCVTEYEATCVYVCRDKDAVYPYEEDCRKYIDCVNGVSKLEKCPQGKAFDPTEKDCVDEKLVDNCFWSEN